MLPSSDPAENLKKGLFTETGGYDPSAFTLPGGAPMAAPTNPLVERYRTGVPSDPLAEARAELAKQMKDGSSSPDVVAIREQTKARLQPIVDATQKYYDELRAKEEAAGIVRARRTQGINVRAGLGGSDFASANAEATDKENKSAIQAIESERALKLTSIFDTIDERATKETETARKLASENAEKRVSLLSQIQDQARKDITEIAKGGFSLEKFREDPAYQQVLKESGLSEFELDAMYSANLPKKAAKDINYQKIGNNKIAAFYVGDDGTIKKQEYDFEIPAEKDLKVIDGVPYLYDPTTQVLEPARGFAPKPKETDAVVTADGTVVTLSKDQSARLSRIVDDVRVDPDVKSFVEIRDGYERVQTGAQLNNAQGDLSLLFGYMKLLDPNSVVRETEFANAEAAMGYAQRILNIPAKAIKGERLTPEARKQFSSAAKDLYRRKEASYKKAADYYEGRAKADGLDPKLVMRDYGTTVTDPTADQMRSQLKPGEIMVKDNKTGQVGAVPEKEFDSKIYTKL